MSTLSLIILFSVVSGVLSLLGGLILLINTNWVRKFSIHFVSFAAGALLAVAFLDVLPEALELTLGKREEILVATLAGILVFFAIERLILFQFHGHADDTEAGARHVSHATPILLNIGDAFHNFIDGVAIAAAFLVNAPLGILTALSVAAHEIPQEIGDFSVMLHHGWKKNRVLWLNILVSLTNVIGALAAYAARDFVKPILPQLLGFTAGIFIYIAASDLIPQLAYDRRADKPSHVFGFLFVGVLAVWFLGRYLGA